MEKTSITGKKNLYFLDREAQSSECISDAHAISWRTVYVNAVSVAAAFPAAGSYLLPWVSVTLSFLEIHPVSMETGRLSGEESQEGSGR